MLISHARNITVLCNDSILAIVVVLFNDVNMYII